MPKTRCAAAAATEKYQKINHSLKSLYVLKNSFSLITFIKLDYTTSIKCCIKDYSDPQIFVISRCNFEKEKSFCVLMHFEKLSGSRFFL